MSGELTGELTAGAFSTWYVTIDPRAGGVPDCDDCSDRERAARLLAAGYIRPGYPWRSPVAISLEPLDEGGVCEPPRVLPSCPSLQVESAGGGLYTIRRRADARPTFRGALLDVMGAAHREERSLRALRAGRQRLTEGAEMSAKAQPPEVPACACAGCGYKINPASEVSEECWSGDGGEVAIDLLYSCRQCDTTTQLSWRGILVCVSADE